MSSDEGITDYHYHKQLSPKKLHHQPLSIHNGNVNQCNDFTSTSTQTSNCCDINGSFNGGTIKRRKSLSNASLTAQTNIIQLSGKSIQSIDGSFSDVQSHPNDDNKSIANNTGQNGTTNPGTYRRNCNVPMAFYDPPPTGTPGRLSIHSATDIYDPEMTTCCLPPPSPAPNSDRFIGIQHHQTQQSQRYKPMMSSERYRDVATKCDRYLPPPHYLAAASASMASSNNSIGNGIDANAINIYGAAMNRNLVGSNNSIVTNSTETYLSGYLSSTVHTPVKRYIPSTNSMPTEFYSDSTVVLPHHQQTPRISSQSNCNTLTSSYRYRMKCCSNIDGTNGNDEVSMGANIYRDGANAFATTPRASPKTLLPSAPNVVPPYGSQSFATPTMMPTNTLNNPTNSNSANGTCLHCNTMRRTTGVHQTTQTGPVSPIPQNMNNKTIFLGYPESNEYDKMTNSSAPGLRAPQQQIQPQPQQQNVQPQTFNRDVGNPQSQPQPQQQLTPQQSQLESQENLVQAQPVDESDQLSHSSSSRKQKIKQYVKREVAKFFGVDVASEERERVKWSERQKRLALRRFGSLKQINLEDRRDRQQHQTDRPDILPVDHVSTSSHHYGVHALEDEIDIDDDDDDEDAGVINHHLIIERKASVSSLLWIGLQYAIQAFTKKVPRHERQWSRSFAPQYLNSTVINQQQHEQKQQNELRQSNMEYAGNDQFIDNANASNLQENELFFDSSNAGSTNASTNGTQNQQPQPQQPQPTSAQSQQRIINSTTANAPTYRGTRISSQLLDGVQDNSRRPTHKKLKLLHVHELDDRYDHRPYFTYWINTVQVLVLCLTLICYGFGPIGIGMEKKNGQVLVTSLSLQQVQHQEPRNIWIGPRGDDLVHLGAKFAACMRRDLKILDVMAKTRRQERETACCIRNDDSGCVQSSQADCSVRGLWPTKSISTWKKWSPGESGPGGRISGSVCGLDPKYCDAPASIAPYEWPDDITKWPICRKTNSFSQRFRYKDHTAEHMVCEVIGHPCCISVYGECRITTREFCDFVNGYFHEEASLCSQVSCLNDICGMFPFISTDAPDQFYRLFTSLCLHAGIIHLVITVAFQHIFLTDLERLLGPIRTAILYIGSGVAGNLISAIFLPYKPEVGPLASIAGVVSSMAVLLFMIHWKQLKRPHLALMKLIFLAMCIFAIGTLPWQQHIIGIIGGILCGTVLTITMVPFLSITTKYGRKAKVKLVWTCVLLHIFIDAALFILFLCPSVISSIGLWDSTSDSIGGIYTVGGNIVACDNNKGMQCGGSTNGQQGGGIVRSAINI